MYIRIYTLFLLGQWEDQGEREREREVRARGSHLPGVVTRLCDADPFSRS